MSPLQDSYSRVIDYLRISITDKCNLRCIYCMPPDGIAPVRHTDILSYEEIVRVAAVAARLGVKKIRLTGGEPLVRKDIAFLVASLRAIPGIEDLSLTTNGSLLGQHAGALAHAGLDRVNVSIDSFRPERYREITRGGDLEAVLKGVQAAEDAGLRPLKINMVPMRGVNEDEILDFARITIASERHVRFIECMPVGSIDFWDPGKCVTTDEIRRIIATLGPLSPVRVRKNGPSKYYRVEGAKGVLGFISALSHHYCGDCNRLRLTADGKLRPCLFSETEIDIRSAIRAGAADDEIERLLRLSIEVKPKGHTLSTLSGSSQPPAHAAKRSMSRIGG
ncbi:MAG TPA: GTP 3',8-cyclase MoaA [Thermodesulfovibrionales bacterium]|nr:GTP 3',8-cyclase MoaA [Thermodesulfovibrionales bacterium]